MQGGAKMIKDFRNGVILTFYSELQYSSSTRRKVIVFFYYLSLNNSIPILEEQMKKCLFMDSKNYSLL